MKKIGIMFLSLLIPLASYAGIGKQLAKIFVQRPVVREIRGGVVRGSRSAPKMVKGAKNPAKTANGPSLTVDALKQDYSFSSTMGNVSREIEGSSGYMVENGTLQNRDYLLSTSVTEGYEFRLEEPRYIVINQPDLNLNGIVTFEEMRDVLDEDILSGKTILEKDPASLVREINELENKLQEYLNHNVSWITEEEFLEKYAKTRLQLRFKNSSSTFSYEKYMDWMNSAQNTLDTVLTKLRKQTEQPDQVILTNVDIDYSFEKTLFLLDEAPSLANFLKDVPEEMQLMYESINELATYLAEQIFGKEGVQLVSPGFEEGAAKWLKNVRRLEFEPTSLVSNEDIMTDVPLPQEEQSDLGTLNQRASKLYISPAIEQAEVDEFWRTPSPQAFAANYYETHSYVATNQPVASVEKMYEQLQNLVAQLKPAFNDQKEFLALLKDGENYEMDQLIANYQKVCALRAKIDAFVSDGIRGGTEELPRPLSTVYSTLKDLEQLYHDYMLN